MKRNPRKDPAPGDVIEYQCGDLRNTHTVKKVENSTVYYVDEGLRDYVSIEKWRSWYVGRRGVKILAVGAND